MACARDLLSDCTVAASRLARGTYDAPPPFHPGSAYPEYPFGAVGETNAVYDGVRRLWQLLRFDEERCESPEWNPLGVIVRPGDKVVVKPNLLWHSHKHRPAEWQQVVTHGSVVRAVVDYVLIALRGTGEVWIVDGPQSDADWEKLIARTGLDSVTRFYEQVSSSPVRLLDLREVWLDVRGDVCYGRKSLAGDPAGDCVVDLGEMSRLAGHPGGGRYHGAEYNERETNAHHTGGRHEYRISSTVATCDVLINIPKMKTHKKVGVTLAFKNLVGVSTGRNWMPHYTAGSPETGGDQFSVESTRTRSERLGVTAFRALADRVPLTAPLFRVAKQLARPIWGGTDTTVRSGNWYGNDTCWRMVLDIARAVYYHDRDGYFASQPKRSLVVVDGIVAGEGNGPETPEALTAGVLTAGVSPAAVDCVTTRLMGFDPLRIPVLCEAFRPSELPLASFGYEALTVCSDNEEWAGPLALISRDACLHMRPHFGWSGHIELDPLAQEEPISRSTAPWEGS